jgi:hypothetical protein
LIPFVNRNIEHLNLLEELNEFAHPNEVGLNIPKTENYARIKHFLRDGRRREQSACLRLPAGRQGRQA